MHEQRITAQTEPKPQPHVVELANFLYHSFYYSQGNTRLQRLLLWGARESYQELIAACSEQDRQDIVERTAQRAETWLRHGPHPKTPATRNAAAGVRSTISGFEATLMTGKLPKYAQRHVPARREQLPMTLSQDMVLSDYQWIVAEKEGRPNRKSNPQSTFNRPYLSHSVHYALLGNTTGNAVMDGLFAAARTSLLTRVANPDMEFDCDLREHSEQSSVITEQLRAVIQRHCSHQPDDKVRLEAVISPAVLAPYVLVDQ